MVGELIEIARQWMPAFIFQRNLQEARDRAVQEAAKKAEIEQEELQIYPQRTFYPFLWPFFLSR